MEISAIIQILGIIIVLFNTIVSGQNSRNLRKNDEEQKSQWDAIDRRALKDDVLHLKNDLKEDIKESEDRANLKINEIKQTIQVAKTDIMTNIDRLVGALTSKGK